MAAIINWTPAGKILKLVWQEPAAFYPHLGTTKTAFVFHETCFFQMWQLILIYNVKYILAKACHSPFFCLNHIFLYIIFPLPPMQD